MIHPRHAFQRFATSVDVAMTPVRSESDLSRPSALRQFGVGIAVALAYIAAARLGFRFAFVAEQVTTVWAPSGIAIASLLIWGPRLWPAIWLGAFVVNAGTSAPFWTAFVVATGNTLEGVIAAWALRRIPLFDPGFRRLADVLAFVGIGVVACTTISATVGSATLCAAGVQAWDRFGTLWFDWWLGDALGALVVAPAILTIASSRRLPARDVLRLALFVVSSAIVTHLVFGRLLGLGAHPLEYIVFPLVVAAAVAGGPPATSAVVLASSAITIWNTVRGTGPFAGSEIHHNLVLLQTFMGVLATTALLLSAAIAERKAIELRERQSAGILREHRDVLSLAMRSGSMGAWSRNLANEEVWWSRELEEIVGLEPGAFDRTETGFFDLVHPDDRPAVRRAVENAIESGSDYIVEFRFRHASGEWRWMEGRGRAVYAEDGTPRTLYGTGIDVTARKRAETALQDAKNAAESANRLKDQFLATLSHELRTPLNAILGYARMLQTNSIAPERRQRAIDIIERNASAQNQLIEDLLDISRITRGQVRLEPTRTLITDVLREAAEGVKPAAEAKRIALDVDLDRSAGTVNVDVTRLQQVFWNLLTNAVKFTDQGGRVTASVRRVANDVEVSVADSGVGIAPDFLPFVFEPFRQADARLARGHGGLGLGLSLSKQPASAGVGQGATFIVRLPARTDSRSAEPAATVPRDRLHPRVAANGAEAPLADVDVLLVDDDEETLTLFRDSIEAAGAMVRAVTSAPDAVRENNDRAPDLLVIDLALHGTDGFELLRTIRTTNPDVSAVAVSAYARLDDRARSLAGGFQAHVSKPIDPRRFVQTLVAAVSLRG
jgi:PAS domain S-box-containing protein